MSVWSGGLKVAVPVRPPHGQVTVGTSEVQLSGTQTFLFRGVVIKADDDNTGSVYVGKTGVTTANGFRLKAGQGVMLEVEDVRDVYLIGSAAGQKVCWIGV